MSGEYIIPLNGLKERRYSFDYHVDSHFFREFENSEINECSVDIIVHLERSSGNFSLGFELNGSVLVTCDRCLGEYRQAISATNRLVVKRGEDYDDSDPDIIVIPEGHHELDLKQLLYDYIILALPIKRAHPDGSGGVPDCDPEMIARIGGVSEDSSGNRSFEKLKELLNDN